MKKRPFESFLQTTEGGCLEWNGVTLKSNGRDSHRYGRTFHNGRKQLAHRVAYERAFGEIPDGLCVLHRCDNTLCCNPDHLFLGTHAENMRDMTNKGRASHKAGSKLFGSSNPRTKLSDSQVEEIRKARAAGATVTALAAANGVHHSYVSRLARGIRRTK